MKMKCKGQRRSNLEVKGWAISKFRNPYEWPDFLNGGQINVCDLVILHADVDSLIRAHIPLLVS